MKISIGIMTSYKLKERYNACKDVWCKDFENVYFFGGDIYDPNLIRLDNVGEDYDSAFLKQQLGLKKMYEYDPNMDWYCFLGCDNILFKNRIDKLNDFDTNKDYIIGQCYNRFETINGININLIAGGGGIFISNSLMKKIYPFIDEFNEHWRNLNLITETTSNNISYPHGDVAIVYMVKKFFGVDSTHLDGLHSQNPDKYKDDDNYLPLTFHYICPEEMKKIYEKYK